MTFTINGIDVSNALIEGTLTIQDRCDTALAQGTCQLYTTLITKNIPPYTLCSIDGQSYFISSEATQDMINTDYWTHDCTILELTAILQCYILGTKCFSASANHYDGDKISMIAGIIGSKYGKLRFITPAGMDSPGNNHDFRFGPGTTMLQALTEIMTWYNYRPKVTSVSFSTTPGVDSVITISKVALDGNQTYTLDSTKLISKVYRQNVDDYGAILESEMKNVVDRTDTITFTGLTCRSENYLFNSDNAVLMLPTRVEEIKKVRCRKAGEWFFDISIIFDDLNSNILSTTNWNNIGLATDSDRMSSQAKSWAAWREILVVEYTDPNDDTLNTIYICDELWNKFFAPKGFNYDAFKDKTWYIWNRPNASNGDTRYRFTPAPTDWANDNGRMTTTYTNIAADLELNIMEKGKWEIQEAKDKPKYAVYESGSNVISNLYGRYNSNVWSDWIGSSTGPVIKESLPNFDYHQRVYIGYVNASGGSLSADCTIKIAVSSDYNPIGYTFEVECIPFTNPIFVDIDESATANETSVKKFSKSYDVAASIVSFDNVIDNISKTNNMLGQPEVSIEYDTTNATLPAVTNRVLIDDSYYYITSFTREIHRNYETTYINLCSSYSKVADAIGVETQFQSTRLPMDEVIERPIYIKGPTLHTNPDVSNCLGEFIFYDKFNNKISKVYKRVVKMSRNDKIYFYFEAYDNYAFDKRIRKLDGSVITSSDNVESGNYACDDISYGDINNEAYSVTIRVVDGIDLKDSKTGSYEMNPILSTDDIPNYDLMPAVVQAVFDLWLTLTAGSVTTLFNAPNRVVYKDTREKLTFTIICDYEED